MRVIVLLFVFLISMQGLFAQHEDHTDSTHSKNHPVLDAAKPKRNHKMFRHHIAITTGNSYVPKGGHGQDLSGRVIAPSYGLDYVYYVNPKFGFGTFNDWEQISYIVVTSHEEDLKRENALITTACVVYKPLVHWMSYVGYGREFEKNLNLQVVRLGVEYEIPIRNNFEVSFGGAYDFKEEYDSWSLMISFTKMFGKELHLEH